MSTSIDLQFAILWPVVALSAIAVVTDLARGKVFNWLTLPGMLTGLAWGFWRAGWPGVGTSLLGIAAGFALLVWIFALGFMGAGDVKLLMALGAWGGPGFALKTAVLSLFIGGLLGAIQLATRGALMVTLRKTARLLQSLAIRELEVEVPKIDRKHTMAYAIPLGVAAVWILVSDPFVELARQGLWPW